MKVRSLIAAVLLCLAVAGPALGQGRSVLTLGANYWKADWNIEGIKPGHMFGPYVNLRSGKLTLGGSLFTGSYKPDEAENVFGDDMNLKRTDLNLSIGYNLGRYFNVFGAFKNTRYTLKGTMQTLVYDMWTETWLLEDVDVDEEFKCSYLGGGGSLVFPITNSPLFLYGSGAYLAAQEDDWADITTLTFGVGFKVSPQVTLMAGFRSDVYGEIEGSDLEDDGAEKEKMQGFTASLAYTLR